MAPNIIIIIFLLDIYLYIYAFNIKYNMYKYIDIYVYSKIDLLRLSYLNLSSAENKQRVFYLTFQIIIIIIIS